MTISVPLVERQPFSPQYFAYSAIIFLICKSSRGAARFPFPEECLIIDETHTYERRIANRAVRNVEEQTCDGDRYEFEVLVEAPESASDYGSKLREVLDEGLVLERSDDFSAVRFTRHEDLGR